jgi:competence protein ComEC
MDGLAASPSKCLPTGLDSYADSLCDGSLADHVGGDASPCGRYQVEDAGALRLDGNPPRPRQIGKQLEEIVVRPRANRTAHEASVCSFAAEFSSAINWTVLMRRIVFVCALLACLSLTLGAARTLDIYFIDVEGGQATLVVTPTGESLLIDTGFPSDGTFQSVPGDPAKARDANRIFAAARDAGLKRLDYVLLTHFHADHDGGVVELSRLLPIRTFVDHGSPLPEVESVAGSLKMFEAYAAVRAKARHLEPAAGVRLPLKNVEALIVSAAGATITTPVTGAGARTHSCAPAAGPPEEPNENPRSTGVRLQYGAFTFLDVGDLSGQPLYALACPQSLIGPVDVYLVAHHGGPDASDPATFEAFKPRVALFNNGARKGGVRATLSAAASVQGMDVWQLHKRDDADVANTAGERIANLDETTAHRIKISANANGSFTVTNGRTGQTKPYSATSASSRTK